ncbi:MULTISPECIES: helix-turn-helix transcriptional regulator [Nocardia]|uniref:helix-turn-helix transcriptional regulator n=1 Tax=Nocardia TaxID=1817 RepID=UPI000D69939A|nr:MULTISPECIES: LuxR family transcriptional regulator [Nocardia]
MGGDFVGRVHESELLAVHLGEVVSGRGRLVLIAGEPGIGKTCLAREAAARAGRVGMSVAWGRASDDAGSPPYWIFRQVARGLGASLPSTLTSGGSENDSATARFEDFEEFTQWLREVAEPHGMLVVLDDLQWTDAATLALLVHVVRGMAESRLMLVAAYRDTEIDGGSALTAVLPTLAHEAAQTRIRLAGLPADDVRRQLELMTGQQISDDVAAAVVRRTGGNPFFVTEMAPLIGADADILPAGALDAVRARLARLSAPCRELMSTAAALGDEAEPASLAAVTEHPLPVVLAALDEAELAGLLIRADGWRFRQDLIREGVRAGLPTAARAVAHAGLAAWLSARSDADERAGEIAHHWLTALPMGDPRQAVEWAERAGDRALASLAWEQAAEFYRRAMEVAALTDQYRARLLLGHGIALLRNGDIRTAETVLAQSAEIARAAADPHALGAVALAIEGVSDPWGTFTGARLAAEALAQLPAEDSSLRVRLLALRAGEAGFVGGADCDRISAQALAMAGRLGDASALRSALRARQMARSDPGGVHERLHLSEQMLVLGESEHDDDTALWGRLWRYDALMMLGRLDEAEAELAPMRQLAQRSRRPLARWRYLRAVSAVAISRGRFDEAEATASEGLRLIEGRTHDSVTATSVLVLTVIEGLTGRGGHVSAEQFEMLDGSTWGLAVPTYCVYRVQRGDLERARRLYRLAPGVEAIPQPGLLPGLAHRIELAATFGEPEVAADLAARLRPHADLFATSGAGTVTNLGSAHTYLGMAAAVGGRLDEAAHELRRGITANDAAGTPSYAALARLELARTLTRRRRPGDLAEADTLCATVAETAGLLSMAPLRSHAEELAAELRGDRPGGLTPREGEVAEHLARGLTNKQIAALMHISERTAESHVQHILTKLGFTNRTQVAAWSADRR